MAQKALSYDGVDDWVEVGTTADFKFLHGALDTSNFKFTIEFWMKLPNPEPGVSYGLVSTQYTSSTVVGTTLFYQDTSPRSRQFGFIIGRGVGGAPVIDIYSDDNAYPNDSNWHYIVITYDQSLASNNYKLYVDAVLKKQATKTGNTPSTSNSAHELHIGSLGNETYEAVATIDEVRISDKVRSPSEISAAWNNGNGVQFEVDANTVALWHFNEGEGSIAYDETENDHDGTITGASWVDGFPFLTEKTSSDTGSGVEALLNRDIVLTQGGAAIENVLARAIILTESGLGAETSLILASLLLTETVSGLDALVELLKFAEKFGSDTGSGVEALLNRAIVLSDLASGADALVELLQLIEKFSSDTGSGTDVLSALLSAIIAGEIGSGSDQLKAKIITSAGAFDMRLPTTTGKVEIPSKEVNL